MESVFRGIKIVVENNEHYIFEEEKMWMYLVLYIFDALHDIFKEVNLTW